MIKNHVYLYYLIYNHISHAKIELMTSMCRKNERFADCLVIERDRFVYGNNMILGGIAFGRRTPLHIIHENTNALI